MSGNTSVPSPTFGPNGFILPLESAILAGVAADYNAAFGGDLNPAPETPQGQLTTSTTAIIGDCNDQFLNITQQVDPAYATGRMQDAIARIYFLERNPAQPTSVQATCVGEPNIPIPQGSLATDGTSVYASTAPATIPSSGTIVVPFANLANGPIPCPAGSLNQIYQAIPGWDTVDNLSDGILGADVEDRADFEHRRELSVALNASGTLPAILAAVLSVPDVLDAYATENDTTGNVTTGGVVLAPNSLYVCVAGGDPQAVANAIWSKKAPGCGYTGNTTETVYDSNSGYVEPFPSYSVSFQEAADLPIIIAVTIKNSTGVPSNVVALVQAAIVAAFSGADGGQRARIGGTIYASRYYAGIAGLGPWAIIIDILVGSPNAPQGVVTASIANTTMNVTAVSSGNVTIGSQLLGNMVIPGTSVISQGNGTTGGVGNYTVSNSQTATSETVTAVVPNLYDLQANINQAPTINQAQITVTLQ